ncbi:DNRLRE domain-containing protein [Thermomicrobiaceae bacterium CFH 74404]|uniref:DNRLRE domain-containing protein n=1 Tax=Thermalbibacter longus TaxID=2951981 RepID=A0AA41WE82_9BACT|nr:DNRLRE domain-containing protein [Thermalbibacter longus]MCM8750442.1 DNRLRE domain-containing protein [Thermalbibacter longus]
MDSKHEQREHWSSISMLPAGRLLRSGLQQARRFREVLLLAAVAGAIWLLLAWPATGGPQEMRFSPDADTYVEERSPDTSFGAEAELLIDGSPRRETYLRFTVTGIQGPVQRATLRVYVTDSTANGPIAYAASNDWDEETLTWSNRPAIKGSPLHDHCTLKAGTWAEFDVTALVTSDGTYTIALIPNSDDGLDVSSREGQHAPELVVVLAESEEPTTPPVEDSEPPDTLIDSGPHALSSSTSASFAFHATEEGSSFHCRLDGGAASPCTSPVEYTGLSAGDHTFEVQATDATGNVDPTPASFTWTVDTSPPSVPTGLTASAAGPTQVDLSWSASSDDHGIAGYQIYRDDELLATVGDQTAYSDTTVTGGSTYSYSVLAWDLAGNLSSASTPVTVTLPVATSPPDTVIDSGPPAFTDSQEASFSFHATEQDSSFQCRLDGGAYSPCSSGQTYTGLAEGEHSFEVRALDADGNADPTPAAHAWIVDRTPPSPPADLSAVVAGPGQIDLTWTAATDSSPIAGYDLYRDGALLASLGDVTSHSDTSVSQGTTYTYEVRARDAAGNLSEPSASATVTMPEPAPPPSSGDPVVIVAAGDIACDPQSDSWNDNAGTDSACRHKYTSDVALAQSPDYVLVLGDTQYEDGALQEYRASYDPTWGRLLDRTYPAVGNHEYRTGGAAGYFAYFGDRATPLEPGCRKDCKGYYAWALDEHWVAIAVNSNCDEVGGCRAGSPQYQFVASVFEANAGKHFLVYMHHPYWSTGKYHNCCKGELGDLYKLFERYGVELTLSGHDHNYQRFAPQTASSVCSAGGIRHFVVGNGGKNLQDTDANKSKEPCDEYLNETSFGVLVLRLFPDRYEWSFVSESGAVLDQGTTPVD